MHKQAKEITIIARYILCTELMGLSLRWSYLKAAQLLRPLFGAQRLGDAKMPRTLLRETARPIWVESNSSQRIVTFKPFGSAMDVMATYATRLRVSIDARARAQLLSVGS